MAVCISGGSKSAKSSDPRGTIFPKSSDPLGPKKRKLWYCHFFVCKKIKSKLLGPKKIGKKFSSPRHQKGKKFGFFADGHGKKKKRRLSLFSPFPLWPNGKKKFGSKKNQKKIFYGQSGVFFLGSASLIQIWNSKNVFASFFFQIPRVELSWVELRCINSAFSLVEGRDR